MPLPTNPDLRWPPNRCKGPNEQFDIWGAWYSGKRDRLTKVYADYLPTLDPKDYSGFRGGGTMLTKERFFWGNVPLSGTTVRPHRLHIPLAGDICTKSAGLLFGEAPRPRSDKDQAPAKTPADKGVLKAPSATQKFLDLLLDEGGWHSAQLESGEIAAAYSGAYLRLGWDPVVAAHPLLDVITPDHAVPEWRSGRLHAVTFWRVLEREDDEDTYDGDGRSKVLRHLERHEMHTDGKTGRILHGLYEGTQDKLGQRVDLGGHVDTRPFETLPNEDDGVRWDVTGCTGLSVEFLTNLRPPKALDAWHPYGRADLDAIEGEMDSLDETWSSLIRDLRNGKGRVVIPEVFLQNLGPGRGALYDPEQDVYAPVTAMGRNDGAMDMQVVQFQIRTAEHLELGKELICVAVESAGYDAQTFGRGNAEVAATATEINARQINTNRTRGRKIGYARPSYSRLYARALEMAAAKGVKGIRPAPVRLQWPDGVPDDQEAVARTLQMFHAAESISLYERIKTRRPDMEEWEVLEEIDRIREDQKFQVKINTPPDPPGSASTGFDEDGNKTSPDPGEQEKKTE